MPYIIKENREHLESGLLAPASPGDLNYLFTKEVLDYIDNKGESYQTYNDCIGALESCKLELYRRLVARYEDTKVTLNGDVY